MSAALDLLASQSFDATSLRELTRAVGVVPTAFYRHFSSMEELGLELVDASFASLRRMLRAARDGAADWDTLAGASVRALAEAVQVHPRHLRFIARERHGGVDVLRRAIHRELALAVEELAGDLSEHPQMGGWSPRDRRALADLVVTVLVVAAGRLLEAPPDEQPVIARRTEHQLRILAAGVPHWRTVST